MADPKKPESDRTLALRQLIVDYFHFIMPESRVDFSLVTNEDAHHVQLQGVANPRGYEALSAYASLMGLPMEGKGFINLDLPEATLTKAAAYACSSENFRKSLAKNSSRVICDNAGQLMNPEGAVKYLAHAIVDSKDDRDRQHDLWGTACKLDLNMQVSEKVRRLENPYLGRRIGIAN